MVKIRLSGMHCAGVDCIPLYNVMGAMALAGGWARVVGLVSWTALSLFEPRMAVGSKGLRAVRPRRPTSSEGALSANLTSRDLFATESLTLSARHTRYRSWMQRRRWMNQIASEAQ